MILPSEMYSILPSPCFSICLIPRIHNLVHSSSSFILFIFLDARMGRSESKFVSVIYFRAGYTPLDYPTDEVNSKRCACMLLDLFILLSERV